MTTTTQSTSESQWWALSAQADKAFGRTCVDERAEFLWSARVSAWENADYEAHHGGFEAFSEQWYRVAVESFAVICEGSPYPIDEFIPGY